MKKLFVAVAVGIGILAIGPTETQAQFYSNYAYNNNAYMNYAMASQRARAAGRKARVSKWHHKKRYTVHKSKARRHTWR